MIGKRTLGITRRPAFLLAAGILVTGLGVQFVAAEEARDRQTHRVLVSQEKVVASAIQSKRKFSLSRAARRTGTIVDAAFALKENGYKATACDLGAMALTNAALLAERIVANPKSAIIFLEGFKSASKEFANEIRACERVLNLPPSKRQGLDKMFGNA